MPNYTTNLNLEKPLQSEQYNVDVFNANADKIDQFAGQVPARALTADKLTTGAKINGVNFKGDSDIVTGAGFYYETVTYGAGDLAFIYNQNDGLELYKSLSAGNIGHNPLTTTGYWEKQVLGGSALPIGFVFHSITPQVDASLHLLDGARLSGDGIYSAFVTHMARLVTDYPNLFVTESDWQTSVAQNGVCGKFVYDSVNNTVRLPKITGIVEGTTDVTALGDLVQAGLPDITHSHTRGSMNITGDFYFDGTDQKPGYWGANGAFTMGSTSTGYGTGHSSGLGATNPLVSFDASRSWTGATSDNSLVNSIYGNSSTVQPQTIKVLYYIVIATSAKTDIQVDIDEIATDLNGKADTDLLNLTTSGENRLHALKGYLDEGELLTNTEGLTDLKSLAYSTFELSKFTLVGNPDITDDGIYTSTSTAGTNYVSTSNLSLSGNVEFHFRVKLEENSTGGYVISDNLGNVNEGLYINEWGASWTKYSFQNAFGYRFFLTGNTYDIYVKYNSDLTFELGAKNIDNDTYSVVTSTYSTLPSGFLLGQYAYGTERYVFDLKRVSVTSDGVPVFAGTQTGTDEYTINGQTVSIPYTLSKTGSKIVDSNYRTEVSALYAQVGNAPYYTLSDTDYTLPQGELYGKIQTAYTNVLPDYANVITMGFPVSPTTSKSTFTAPSDGWANIHGQRQGATGGTLRCYVNNHVVAVFVGLSQFGSSAIFPVSKNDIISVDVDTNSTWTIIGQYFYPAKGAD